MNVEYFSLVENFNRQLHLSLMVDRFHSSYREYYLALSQALRGSLNRSTTKVGGGVFFRYSCEKLDSNTTILSNARWEESVLSQVD